MKKNYVRNKQLFVILILWLEYQNTNASKKTFEKLVKYQKNALEIHTGTSEYTLEQNDNVKSEYDTKTFNLPNIDEEKGMAKNESKNEFTCKILQQDQFIDIWGYKINWYDKEDGWTELRRNQTLKYNQIMMKQIKNMPSYTKYGYQKMKIPFELHDFILQGIKQTSSRLVNEPCAPNDPFHNCQRVKDDGSLGNNAQCTTNTLGSKLK